MVSLRQIKWIKDVDSHSDGRLQSPPYARCTERITPSHRVILPTALKAILVSMSWSRKLRNRGRLTTGTYRTRLARQEEVGALRPESRASRDSPYSLRQDAVCEGDAPRESPGLPALTRVSEALASHSKLAGNGVRTS